MRTALLADIHSNLEALEACLAHARREGVDRFAFLGDLLGYGADPGACLEIVAGLVQEGALAVRGNHDEACLGGVLPEMHFIARDAIYWTRERLGEAERAFIAGLPLTVGEADRLYAHASAERPQDWIYVVGTEEAARAFAATPARLVFVGHVHHPLLYFTTPAGTPRLFEPMPGVPLPLSDFRRWLVIAGAVGQPRDGNPAACYALHDHDAGTLTHFRVPYDVDQAARKILDAGLPEKLAWRLIVGE
ncbi:MAG: metallophosphoesterase family protein [Betaproteobacteria bacterium]|nr:metallophosphoesterase family protein [Betaproteobacteria bacterium]